MSEPANGYVPASALAEVQIGMFLGHPYSIDLETATAAAWNKARNAKPTMYLSPDLGGYRSAAQQLDLHNHPAAHDSTLKPSQIRSSNGTHELGTCVDVGPENVWFQAHCAEYGFVRESPAGENNHYRYLHPTWAPALPVLAPSARVAGPFGVNARAGASTTAALLLDRGVKPNSAADFAATGRGYVRGDTVTVGSVTSDLWYVAPDLKAYFAAAAFKTPPSTVGLAELPSAAKPTSPVTPTVPAVTPVPVQPAAPAAPAAPTSTTDEWPAATITEDDAYTHAAPYTPAVHHVAEASQNPLGKFLASILAAARGKR